MRTLRHLTAVALVFARSSLSLNLNVDDTASIKSVASTIAHGMLTYYHGNETGMIPGLLPSPYYWWECGAMFNSLINYWYYTGDTTYNQLVKDGLLFQTGPNNDFMVCFYSVKVCSTSWLTLSASESNKCRGKRRSGLLGVHCHVRCRAWFR